MRFKEETGTVARKLLTLSEEGRPWCGVEVEAYWICRAPSEQRKGDPQRIHVRAHATRLTMLREQRNRSRNVYSVEDAAKWVARYFRVMKRWEAARRTRPLVELSEPWTDEEIERLKGYRAEPSTASLRIHVENREDYELAERLMVLGEPDWRRA